MAPIYHGLEKSWVHLPRVTSEYREGTWNFINKALKYNEQLVEKMNANTGAETVDQLNKISCPYSKCRNSGAHLSSYVVFEHLVCDGMDPTYTTWILHGEQHANVKNVCEENEFLYTYRMYADAFDHDVISNDTSMIHDEIVGDSLLPLYPGFKKSTKISATLALYQIKTENGLSTKSFNELLKAIHDHLLPDENLLPKSNYEIKKFLKCFNLNYEKIHACENDCCLFRKEFAKLDKCPKCSFLRYKNGDNNGNRKKNIPVKVLRYFPIIPRLRRMFKSQETSEQLRWHDMNKSKDGKLRHPVDSLAWKKIDKKWPSFASDPINLRFGLATDGFSPFSDPRSTYSC